MKNTELKKVDFENLEAVTGGGFSEEAAIRPIDPSKDGLGNALGQPVIPAPAAADEMPGSSLGADDNQYEAFQRVVRKRKA